MTNLDFDKTPFITRKDPKSFGSAYAAADFFRAVNADQALRRTLSALQQYPIRFRRDNVIASEGDAIDYVFFVVKGVIRSCKTFENGDRRIVAFYVPGDVFGWSDATHSLSVEAAANTELLFIKRSGLLSVAS